MARKSKRAMMLERLNAVSKCPEDIFDRFDSDEVFELLERAERNDLAAINKLVSEIKGSSPPLSRENEALLYLLRKGVGLGDVCSAEEFLRYFSEHKHGYDLLWRALELSEGKDSLYTPRELTRFKSDLAVYLIGKEEKDERLQNLMQALDRKDYLPEWIYLYGRGKADTDKIRFDLQSELQASSLSPLISLLLRNENDYYEREEVLNCIKYVCDSLTLHTLSAWRDFWLRISYELCEKYLDSDFTSIADVVIDVSESRTFYKYYSLHSYAWAKYKADKALLGTPEQEKATAFAEKLRQRCSFERISPLFTNDAEQHELMRNCIYLSTDEELVGAQRDRSFGIKIEHYKNRYNLCAELANHAKRGKMHLWTLKISIFNNETQKSNSPTFSKIKVFETNKDVTRGGASNDTCKGKSQILCRGELLINDEAHPFELDLILDISYISAVKCGECEIVIKASSKTDGYVVMDCEFLLY